MCNKWDNIIPGQKVEFLVHRKFNFLELPMDWKFRLFCQRDRYLCFQSIQQGVFPRFCNCSESDKTPSIKTLVGECWRWSKASLNCLGAERWNPMGLDLGQSAWWACSRAAHPARLKSTDWGDCEYPTLSGHLAGCPWGWDSVWVMPKQKYSFKTPILLELGFFGAVCPAGKVCKPLFKVIHHSYLELQWYWISLLVWSLSRIYTALAAAALSHASSQMRRPQKAAAWPLSQCLCLWRGLSHIWYVALFSLFCCFCSL